MSLGQRGVYRHGPALARAIEQFRAQRTARFNHMTVLDQDFDHNDRIEPEEIGDYADQAHFIADEEAAVRRAGNAW